MPLTTAQKFKIKEGDTLLTLHAPASFKEQLSPLPAGVTITSTGKAYNQVHWFATNRAQVEKEAAKVLSLVKENVTCWIYFPKGSSKIQTDLSRDKGWDALLAQQQLTWLSLVGFDETWSAFAFRLKNGVEKNKPVAIKERAIHSYVDAAAKTIRLPEDLATAFKKNKAASDFFHTLSYSNRKEYVEWIVTAKQETTRQNRVSGTIERLHNHWKNPRNP